MSGSEGSYAVNAFGAEVKVRSPWAVVGLHAVTLGLYNLYWYYEINRELRDFGCVYRLERLENTNPWLSLLAVTLGALLIVPPFVSWFRCTWRIQDAQRLLGKEPASGWGIALSYIGGFFTGLSFLLVPYLVQEALNGVWRPFRGIDPHSGHDPQQTPISLGAVEMLPQARRWDLGAVAGEDLDAVTHFLLRRDGLNAPMRDRIARELSERLRPKVPDADPALEPERLLELIAAAHGTAPGAAAPS